MSSWKDYTREELEEAVNSILHPEPDEDGLPLRELPVSRLRDLHRLDFSYMKAFAWEGSTTHPDTHVCPADAEDVHTITSNQDVPASLFYSALLLLGESIIEYYEPRQHLPQLRFYPPIILTAWSGFEAFVRLKSELLIATVPSVPLEIRHFLRERSPTVTNKGDIRKRKDHHPVLDRYMVLLRYGYGYTVDRSAPFWRALGAANDLRDHYTHLPIRKPRDLGTEDVLEFLESVFMGIIVPSSHLQRTLLLQVFDLYAMWDSLRELARPGCESPFFKEWPRNESYLFHCNFDGIDKERFPSMSDMDRSRQVLEAGPSTADANSDSG